MGTECKYPKDVSCNICNKLVSKKSLSQHNADMHKNRRYKCLHCQKLFKRDSVKHHISKYHKGANPQDYEVVYLDAEPKESSPALKKSSTALMKSCNICNKFYSKYYIKDHIEDVHKNRRFKCLHCQKLFHRSSFYYHISTQYNGAKFFNHEVVYLDAAPKKTSLAPKQFSCNICNKFYFSKKTLKDHIESLH
jgi:phage FluMu protein Com